MRRNMFMILAACATLFAQGAWYWPFGSKEDDPSKPLRLHRLLEEANNYIEIAEDEALKGNGDAALENYRLALGELDRVERENPDRAETAEFSPLRNKRAACVAAMDAIRFAQVNDNERAVSVTDTRELQKKWNKKHGIKEPEEEKKPETKADDEGAQDEKDDKAISEAKVDEPTPEPPPKKEQPASEPPPKKEQPAPEAPPKQAEPAVAEPVVSEAPAPKPAVPATPEPMAAKVPAPKAEAPSASDFKLRLKTALAEVRNRDYVAADLLLEELMQEKPDDLNVLLLRAAAQTGMGSNYAARRTLEKAMRKHPRSYLPYYNLANLVLQMGESVEIARQYYEMGRLVGGPPSAALEKQLKGEK